MAPKNRIRSISASTTRLILILFLAQTSLAAGTDPPLFLARAVAQDTANGTLIRVEGELPWEGLLQSEYPLALVVWATEGAPEFVRFQLSGQAFTGISTEVVDGLTTPAEAIAFAALGAVDGAQRLTHIGPGRLDAVITLPFASGPIAAQLFVIDPRDGGTPFMSNPIAVERPAL